MYSFFLFLHCLGAVYRNPYTWYPAFLPGTVFKEQSYNLQKEGGNSHIVLQFIPQTPVLIDLLIKYLYLFSSLFISISIEITFGLIAGY